MGGMSKEWKPPEEDAEAFAQYKAHVEGERKLKPEMEEAADRALADGATVGQLARHTGLTPEVFRRRARRLGIEHKRAPTVGRLTGAAPQPDASLAVATPRARVSAALPSEVEPTKSDTEATVTGPLPEMSPREIHKAIKRAMTRAKPDERERLNLTATTAEQLGRDRDGALLRTALEMGLLTADELTSSSEENTA